MAIRLDGEVRPGQVAWMFAANPGYLETESQF